MDFNGKYIPQWSFTNDLDIINIPKFSISAWIRLKENIEGYNIFGIAANDGGYNGSCISLTHNGRLLLSSGPGEEYLNFVIDPPKTDWHHVEINYDRTTNILRIFYDGIKLFDNISNCSLTHTNYEIIGNWTYPPRYEPNQFYGYLYNYEVRDDIYHTKNYSLRDIYNLYTTNNIYGII